VLFPVGEMEKSDVRKLALEAGLRILPRRTPPASASSASGRSRFPQRYLPKVRARIVDEKGRTVGEHIGLAFYTIGQRKGIGLGGAGDAWYVAEKRVPRTNWWLWQGQDHPLLMRKSLRAEDTSWT